MSLSNAVEPPDPASLVAPDIRLVLDRAGFIREVSATAALGSARFEGWVGEHWATTVNSVAEPAIRRIIEDALSGRFAGYCRVVQRLPNGAELPIEYTAAPAADGDGIIAIGRNLESIRRLETELLEAQRTAARQNLQLREAQGRYRLLLEDTDDPVLMLDAFGLRLIEANAAAKAALGFADAAITIERQAALVGHLRLEERQALESMLSLVRTQGTAPRIMLHLGADSVPWLVRATLATAALDNVFVLRMSPAGGPPSTASSREGDSIDLTALMARWPHSFLVVDAEGVILDANDAFLDLAQIDSRATAIGEPLERWFARAGAGAALLRQASRYGFVRAFPTKLRGEHGRTTEIEASAASVSHNDARRYGVMLCDVDLGPLQPGQGIGHLAANTPTVIGVRTLKELSRDAVEALERQCIQQALEKSRGNRTAAAELLGLSRQSLYTKLARYGLAGDPSAAKNAE
jgi:transcriptional regulator PpsR